MPSPAARPRFTDIFVIRPVLAVVIAFVIGIAALRGFARPATPVNSPTVATAPAQADEAGIELQDGKVNFFFASGQAIVAAGAKEALADVVKAAGAGKTVVLSGFHDATGDPGKNVELAKQRALAVRETLTRLGVATNRIELKKPENTLAMGSDRQARRVEVTVR